MGTPWQPFAQQRTHGSPPINQDYAPKTKTKTQPTTSQRAQELGRVVACIHVAPFSNSICTTLWHPEHASCRALRYHPPPSAFTSAPFSSSICTTFSWPLKDAACRALPSPKPCPFTSAPTSAAVRMFCSLISMKRWLGNCTVDAAAFRPVS